MILDIIVRLRVRSAWSERLCVGGVHKVCTVLGGPRRGATWGALCSTSRRDSGIGHDTGHYGEAEGMDRLARATVCERCSA
jgi:hypothetical protein